MKIAGSRCVRGGDVDYQWFGEPLEVARGETIEHALATWFAGRAANQEMAWGVLAPRYFERYKARLAAFLEVKLIRAKRGRLTPGTEVIPVSRAWQQDIPMFELRWHRDERLLSGVGKEQIRHYESEPQEFPRSVFGLHLHLKDVRSGDESIIAAEQNEEIDQAIDLHERNASEGWICPTIAEPMQ
ncbi:hypothetical protein CPA40_06555 [Bifidobacterium callitrichos]|uniref:Uncharacterized protein n=1 Tax=Bifidobacterium callitrichos TaxID=762209 RepID=A0A2T3G9U9_9BIFI|nr:hypothetical protein [Bifidobacterium callitrichos]PST46239.1 hypothetical protein CPA40_06555 [Bifidobacterium callitrichos]